MNEEEKEAIKVIKHSLELEKQLRNGYKWKTGFYENLSIEKLLNLVEKQQKEIEKLNKENTRQQELIGNIHQKWKDKIKEQIRMVEETKRKGKGIDNYSMHYCIMRLKELLGE